MNKDIAAGKNIIFDKKYCTWKIDMEAVQYAEEIEICWDGKGCRYSLELSVDDKNWIKLSKEKEFHCEGQISKNIIKANTRYIKVILINWDIKAEASQISRISVYTGIAAEFINGADISHLPQIEDFGGKFFNRQGERQDCLDILKEHGCNYIRLKVWNRPGLPFSDPAGYNDKTHVLQMARRAVDKGFKLLIDFHYSDWWTDPGKQYIPEDWKGLSFEGLNTALYDFTYDVLNCLKLQGTLPQMVQIGNEITNGMLWDIAKISEDFNTPEQWDKLCTLLKAGISAAKTVSKDIKTIIHIERGGDSESSRYFYDRLVDRQVIHDVIGLSYYPIWHGPISDYAANIKDLSERYDKDIAVVEVAYPYTAENGDDQLNASSFPFTQIPGEYPPSVQSQADVLQAVIYELKVLPDNRGIGFFYWQPDFIPVEGAGWKYGEGCEWDDQTLFDFKGNALWSLDVYKLHSCFNDSRNI
ncbi:MAG: Arabinogalactan endo,4-beta-galactosidase [Eubacterium sp.]|jgi:arabinogalactan endo-1,4-beta-galactosidase|nr:Arabinogalactan endo,4-beta-galactosidase [Eubacterium sp.]